MTDSGNQHRTTDLRLFHFAIDSENLWGDEFKTTTEIPKTTKQILKKGTRASDALKKLSEKSVIFFKPSDPESKYTVDKYYKICQRVEVNKEKAEDESEGPFKEVKVLDNPNILYYVLIRDEIKTGYDLRYEISKRTRIQELNQKFNTDILNFSGLILDIKNSAIPFNKQDEYRELGTSDK